MKKRYTISFIILICALIGLFLWNVGVGTVELSLSDLPEIFGKGSDSTLYQVIWKIRLPRIVAAILLGGALSVSGFLLQSFFQNPIAGPYVLGISSGAKLVVALTMIVCLQRSIHVKFCRNGGSSFCGITDRHGICPADFLSGVENVAAGSLWYYDRIYLFRNYRFLRDLCR